MIPAGSERRRELPGRQRGVVGAVGEHLDGDGPSKVGSPSAATPSSTSPIPTGMAVPPLADVVDVQVRDVVAATRFDRVVLA